MINSLKVFLSFPRRRESREITDTLDSRLRGNDRGGFTLIELLIGVAIFSMVSLAVYQGYAKTVEGSAALRVKSAAVDLANEQFEIVHNLPFASVGITSGVPNGVLTHLKTVVRNNISFLVTTTVRNIDDPFDGQVGSTTKNDLSAADYKLVEVEISCSTCRNFKPLIFSTKVAPKNLEAASTNGSLFINVFDANGLPVSDAAVQVVNTAITPNININDVTNLSGQLQIVDTKPSVKNYSITVSKNGYSTDKTYKPGVNGNTNPTKPHSTVALQQLTKISFAIDKVSRLELNTVDSSCNPIGSVPVTIIGAKTIGSNPIIYKFNNSYTTNSSGFLGLDNIEWDNYSFSFASSSYDLIGTNPLWPIFLSPDSTVSVNAVLEPKNSRRLVVTVKDNVSNLAVTDATITLKNSSGVVLSQKISGRGFLSQTNWLGGDGQINYTDQTKFFANSGDIDYSTSGEIKLTKILGLYSSSGVLESSSFDSQISPQYSQILWNSNNNASTTIRMQMAFATSSTATTTWNYVGPDGTSDTYFTTSNQNIDSSASNKRYFRYKIFLDTADQNYTPIVNDVFVTYTSSCTPSGQVSFGGLGSYTYTVVVEKSGYQTSTQSVTMSSMWKEAVFNLMKQ
ncbi:MAG: prepilin-type N-terminal cleavage/methylation domain-containing protein [Minisyncoccia bacterium]